MNEGPPPGEVCSECGKMHPKLPAGEKCSVAIYKKKEVTTDSGIKINVINTVDTLVNMMISQIDKKGIKNIDKLKGQLILNTMKFLEGYKE